MKLWAVKCGFEEPDNLDDVLAVQMGIWTEALNLRWFERKTGLTVYRRNERQVHPRIDYIVSKPDGRVVLANGENAVIDAKHVGAFGYDLETIVQRYRPQLAVQMACDDVEHAVISVFSGSNKWEHEIVPRDRFYEREVLAAIALFWAHVKNETPPHDIPTVDAPVIESMLRKVDMTSSNAWSSLEQDYLVNEASAKVFESTKKELKALVGQDVGEAKGRQLMAKRGKDGSVRFTKVK
jgi:predicted phage-related endonuclease